MPKIDIYELWTKLSFGDFVTIIAIVILLFLIKDWKNIYEVIRSYRKEKKDKKEAKELEKIDKHIEAKSLTGKNRKERETAYHEAVNRIQLRSYLVKWNKRFEYNETYHFFNNTKFSSKDIRARIYNGRIWAKTKSSVFIKTTDELFKGIERDYIEFENGKEGYYKYYRYKFWEDIINEKVAEYIRVSKQRGLDDVFSEKINFAHQENIDIALKKIYNVINRSTKTLFMDLIEDICIILKDGFRASFEELNVIFALNSELTDAMENYKLPSENVRKLNRITDRIVSLTESRFEDLGDDL